MSDEEQLVRQTVVEYITRMRRVLHAEFEDELDNDMLKSTYMTALGVFVGTQLVEHFNGDEELVKALIGSIVVGHKIASEAISEMHYGGRSGEARAKEAEEGWSVYSNHDENAKSG